MAGDSAACGGFIHILKVSAGINCFLNGVQAVLAHRCIGQKQFVTDNVLAVGKAIPDIACQTLGVITTVLFNHTHLAVTNFDARLQIQKICTQRSSRGAATALDHVLQLIQQEAGLHTGNEGIQFFNDLIQILALLGKTACFQNNMALTGGEVLGVNDTHIGEILGRKAGILVAGRETGTNVDMDNAVVLISKFRKQLLIFSNVIRGGGAQIAAGCNMGKNIRGNDGVTVDKRLATLLLWY